MNIFITGGSGFLGKRLLKRLVNKNHIITALSDSPNSDAILQQHGARILRGNLENIEEWSAALTGHDVVIHAAAPVRVWGKWELFHQQITLATRMLYEASAAHGVKRFIFISSESVLQGNKSLLDIDETHPYPKQPNSYYGKAKMLAEKALLKTEAKTECVILRPTFMWGKDNRGLETIVQKVRNKKFIWIDHGRASMEMVHVDNVVEAIYLSLTRGRNRHVYFVTDDHPMPVYEFLSGIFKAFSVQAPKTNIPGWIARPLAASIEEVWRLLRLETIPPLSRFQLDLVALPRRYNIDKIKHDMGFRPIISYQKGVEELRKSQSLTQRKR